MINELDLVALLVDRPALGLFKGDVGTVVHIYGQEQAESQPPLYEVEFVNAVGQTVAVETLEAYEVRAVDVGRVMLHYSDYANAA